LERDNGGPGVYSMDIKKKYLLKDEDWKYDRIPEIFNGKNVADYIDENIIEKLEKLEEEEKERLKNDIGYINWESEEYFVPKEVEDDYNEIESKTKIYVQKSKLKSNGNSHKLPQKYKVIPLEEIKEELISRGVDEEIIEKARSTTRSLSKSRSKSRGNLLSNSKERSVSQARNLEDSKLREDRNSKKISIRKKKKNTIVEQ